MSRWEHGSAEAFELIETLARECPADELPAVAAVLVEWSEDPSKGSPRLRGFLAEMAVVIGGVAHGVEPARTREFFKLADIGRN